MSSQRRAWVRIKEMSGFAAGVIIGAGLSCAVVSAAQVARHDGGFWGKLNKPDKIAYVAGYGDAMHVGLGKIDSLRLAAGIFHWKGANKLLGQVAREMDMKGLSDPQLVAYLNGVYANPRYSDFNVAMALELAAMRGIDANSSPAPASASPSVASGTKQ